MDLLPWFLLDTRVSAFHSVHGSVTLMRIWLHVPFVLRFRVPQSYVAFTLLQSTHSISSRLR